MKFAVKKHMVRKDRDVVEITDDEGRFIASIVEGANPTRIIVISKYLKSAAIVKEEFNQFMIDMMKSLGKSEKDYPQAVEVVLEDAR